MPNWQDVPMGTGDESEEDIYGDDDDKASSNESEESENAADQLDFRTLMQAATSMGKSSERPEGIPEELWNELQSASGVTSNKKPSSVARARLTILLGVDLSTTFTSSSTLPIALSDPLIAVDPSSDDVTLAAAAFDALVVQHTPGAEALSPSAAAAAGAATESITAAAVTAAAAGAFRLGPHPPPCAMRATACYVTPLPEWMEADADETPTPSAPDADAVVSSDAKTRVQQSTKADHPSKRPRGDDDDDDESDDESDGSSSADPVGFPPLDGWTVVVIFPDADASSVPLMFVERAPLPVQPSPDGAAAAVPAPPVMYPTASSRLAVARRLDTYIAGVPALSDCVLVFDGLVLRRGEEEGVAAVSTAPAAAPDGEAGDANDGDNDDDDDDELVLTLYPRVRQGRITAAAAARSAIANAVAGGAADTTSGPRPSIVTYSVVRNAAPWSSAPAVSPSTSTPAAPPQAASVVPAGALLLCSFLGETPEAVAAASAGLAAVPPVDGDAPDAAAGAAGDAVAANASTKYFATTPTPFLAGGAASPAAATEHGAATPALYEAWLCSAVPYVQNLPALSTVLPCEFADATLTFAFVPDGSTATQFAHFDCASAAPLGPSTAMGADAAAKESPATTAAVPTSAAVHGSVSATVDALSRSASALTGLGQRVFIILTARSSSGSSSERVVMAVASCSQSIGWREVDVSFRAAGAASGEVAVDGTVPCGVRRLVVESVYAPPSANAVKYAAVVCGLACGILPPQVLPGSLIGAHVPTAASDRAGEGVDDSGRVLVGARAVPLPLHPPSLPVPSASLPPTAASAALAPLQLAECAARVAFGLRGLSTTSFSSAVLETAAAPVAIAVARGVVAAVRDCGADFRLPTGGLVDAAATARSMPPPVPMDALRGHGRQQQFSAPAPTLMSPSPLLDYSAYAPSMTAAGVSVSAVARGSVVSVPINPRLELVNGALVTPSSIAYAQMACGVCPPLAVAALVGWGAAQCVAEDSRPAGAVPDLPHGVGGGDGAVAALERAGQIIGNVLRIRPPATADSMGGAMGKVRTAVRVHA